MFKKDSNDNGDLIITDFVNSIMITIYNYQSNSPKKWFKYYGRNIGREGKQDINHMYSYQIDQYLKMMPCFVIEDKYDYMCNRKYNYKAGTVLIYFPASIETFDKINILGCLEYFIDEQSILFHRLFRSIESVPDKVKYNFAGIKKFV